MVYMMVLPRAVLLLVLVPEPTTSTIAAAVDDDDVRLARSTPVWHVADPTTVQGRRQSHHRAITAALREAGAAVEVGGYRAATVQLSPGRYELVSSLELPSGVSLRGATMNGSTTLSGGVQIVGWRPDHEGGRPWVWRATLPPPLWGAFRDRDPVHGEANSTKDNAIRQLWVRGQRRGVARSDMMRFDKSLSAGIVAKPGQLRRRYNTTSLRAVTYQHWTAASRPVNGCPDDCNIHDLVCPKEDMPACLNMTCPAPDRPCNQIRWEEPNAPFTGNGCGSNPSWMVDTLGQNGRWYLENSPEFLHRESGTFFADGEDIYYSPMGTDELDAFIAGTVDVVAARPGLRTLLHGGQAGCFPSIGPEYTDKQIFNCGRNVSNTMCAQDLVLEHTDTDELLCLHTSDPKTKIKEKNRCTGQGASHVPSAAVHFMFAEQVQLLNLSVKHVGGFGIYFGAGVRHSSLRHSFIFDTGAGGVRVGETGDGACVPANSPFPEQSDYWCNETRVVHNVTVADSVITQGGNIWPEAPGILLQVADRSIITHNEINTYRYTGISAGWSWTYGQTRSGYNEISHNNISTIGMGVLCDLACVYHLGQDNGTIIRGNLCTNVSSHGYGGAAFYTDQGSSNVTISANVAHDIKCAGFQENFGMNNEISDNIFAFVNTNNFTPHADHGAAMAYRKQRPRLSGSLGTIG